MICRMHEVIYTYCVYRLYIYAYWRMLMHADACWHMLMLHAAACWRELTQKVRRRCLSRALSWHTTMLPFMQHVY